MSAAVATYMPLSEETHLLLFLAVSSTCSISEHAPTRTSPNPTNTRAQTSGDKREELLGIG
jgi:hypothetical protein